MQVRGGSGIFDGSGRSGGMRVRPWPGVHGAAGRSRDQMSPRARFALDLAQQRKEAGMSQAALSTRMRCHTSLISHLERGRRPPTLDFAEALDHAFHLDGHFVGLFRQIAHSPVKDGEFDLA
ncbi:helix-turn-helix domain-containing protein [Nonomuraea cavernae]|uniref:helix-turn-helix domain-containing protein n=1 Tax=Nonomuraea cavernae TaxID=2045107 RepID=UPI0033C3393B